MWEYRKSDGFSLIEVLVALVVTALGVLGLVGAHLNALKFNQTASVRTHATFLAYDMTSLSGCSIPPRGKKFDQLISRPGIIGAGEKEYKYISGSRGGINVTTERGSSGELGRQAWWQLR